MKKKLKHTILFLFTLSALLGLVMYAWFSNDSPASCLSTTGCSSHNTTNTTNTTCIPTTEVCDQKDNDCDGQIDESYVCPSGGGGGGGGGGSNVTQNQTCVPTTEVCDQKDNDCDNQIDENNVCTPTPPSGGTSYLTASPTYTSSAVQTCTNRASSLATAPKDYDLLLTNQLNTPNIVQTVQCDVGQCLWVPWYSSSSSNTVSSLKTDCFGASTDMTHNCMVTDEFSQVGMQIALADNRENEMVAFANTVKKIRGSKYGSIPVWKAKRSGDVISSATGNSDSASDATGRILIALYVGASNTHYSSNTRAMLKALADEIAADQIKYEFTHSCKPTAKYGTICHWLASGSETGVGGLGSNEYSYGGYHGDVTLGLLAAYKSTGNSLYLSYAQDVARQYLVAARYDGSKLTVPPVRYNWITENGVLTSKCVSVLCGSGSGGWAADGADQVRWVSICKAQYYATLNGVTLNKDLGVYCKQATEISCYGQTSWCVQVNADGTSSRASQGGVMSNGLGASLNYYYKQSDLQSKLYEIFNGHFGSGTPDGSVFGVYNNAFAMVNLGSAIGRDVAAYGTQTSGQYCT
jgi:hypothetical protein